MRVKDGVLLAGLKIEMRPVLKISERVWKKQSIVYDPVEKVDVNLSKEGVTVTSGLDGVHSAGSLHPFGYAVDLRTRYFKRGQVGVIAHELQVELDKIDTINKYDVIIEEDHIHVEYDIEKFK